MSIWVVWLIYDFKLAFLPDSEWLLPRIRTMLMNIKRKSMTQMRPPTAPKADDYMSSYAEK